MENYKIQPKPSLLGNVLETQDFYMKLYVVCQLCEKNMNPSIQRDFFCIFVNVKITKCLTFHRTQGMM